MSFFSTRVDKLGRHMQDQRKSPKDLGLTIYDSLTDHPDCFLSQTELEQTLQVKLKGLRLNQPIRTRSKVVKTAICQALGYPVPKSFLKSQPRFPGQNFDVYTQKSNNLQIWNEALSASRRYVLVRVSEEDLVTTVRVVVGAQLAKLDTSGKLTKKYQATAMDKVTTSRLVSSIDSSAVMTAIYDQETEYFENLLPVELVFVKLRPLLGTLIENPGADQERNRGWALHKAVSKQFGIAKAEDDGQVPDVLPQLLELKLQTSPTVDLGLVSPGSIERIPGFENSKLAGLKFADIRYAIFYGTSVGDKIRLDHLVVATGADFFCFFKRLEGNVLNKKNQIRLPKNFFGDGG
ncbi:MAG: hypothetical protein AB8B55_22085 [Mariniblastus sp.]